MFEQKSESLVILAGPTNSTSPDKCKVKYCHRGTCVEENGKAVCKCSDERMYLVDTGDECSKFSA